MILYTIGFTQKTAKRFFESLIENGVQMLSDVRLNNRSQLAGFAKGEDLSYFLSRLAGIDYVPCPDLAPTKELLSGYRKKEITWPEYTEIYRRLMVERGTYRTFTERFAQYDKVCLLCSEATPECCHRRLAAEMISEASQGSVPVVHIL